MVNSRMACWRLLKFGSTISLQDCPVIQPVGSEVLVRVVGSGVCHSDLHVCEGHFDLGLGKKLPFAGIELPVTLGHEIAGEVVQVGPDVASLAVGARVVVFAWIGCGSCPQCLKGREHLCARPSSLGVNRDGGFAEYVTVPHARYLIDLGVLDPVTAAPLACSGLTTFSALRKFGSTLEEHPLVIIGAGGLGLMALNLLRMMRTRGAVVVDTNPASRAAAMEAGALAAIDPASERVAKQIREAAGGPVQMVLDLVGSSKTAELGLSLLNMDGKLVVVGLIGGSMNLPVPLLPLKSVTIQGSYLGSLEELQSLVAIVQMHGLPGLPINRRPLSAAAAALDDLRAGRVVGRVVLEP